MAAVQSASVFQTGARDDLAVADAYKVTSTKVVSSIQDTLSQTEIDALPAVGSSKSLSTTLKTSMDFVQKKTLEATDVVKSVQPDQILKTIDGSGDLTSRIKNANECLAKGMRTLSPGLAGDIMGGMRRKNSMYSRMGGKSRNLKPSAFETAMAIGGIVSCMTGNKDVAAVVDTGTRVGSLVGVVSAAAKNGVPNSFGALSTTMTDINTVNSVASGTLDSVLKYGDKDSLMCMADKTTPGTLKQMRPDVISTYAANYKLDTGATSKTMQAAFDESKTLLNKVDPSWGTTGRTGANGVQSSILDITKIQSASPDFFRSARASALKSTSEEDKLFLIAGQYAKTDVGAELAAQFA